MGSLGIFLRKCRTTETAEKTGENGHQSHNPPTDSLEEASLYYTVEYPFRQQPLLCDEGSAFDAPNWPSRRCLSPSCGHAC